MATLKDWARHIRTWREFGKTIYVFFDNDQKSAAPKDARRLLRILTDKAGNRRNRQPLGTLGVIMPRFGAGRTGMPRRASFMLSTPSDARTATLQGILIGAIVIGALYFGREVLLPLALAILLSFILTPPLLLLRRIKLPRVVSVGIVVGAAFAIILALGWVLSREVTQLASDLPSYQYILSEKIKSLREGMPHSPTLERAGEVLSELQRELATPEIEPSAEPKAGPEAERPRDKPLQVEIREREPSGFELYQRIAGTVLPPLATAGIVLLFVVFILHQREDLRDRLIRLFGASDLQRATATLNDAATRLSRYFLSMTAINFSFGALITLALWLMGIPSPIVWGVLAALMRFVPFIGPYIAAAFPILLAAAVDPGWWTVIITAALFLVTEISMGQIVEPLVFGRGTGISPLAVIISTIFWTWLWGPLGLFLAMPITVCLAVLGRHVEGLEFFEVVLGDEPALTPEKSFYQRALSGDAAEATYEVELCLNEQSLESCLDQVALPALKLAEHDARRGLLDEEQAAKIANTVKEMLVNLSDFEPRRWFFALRPQPTTGEEAQGGLGTLAAAEAGEEDEALPVVERDELAPGWVVDEPILCIGGRSALDEAAAAILAEVLKKRGLGAKGLGPEVISAAHIASLGRTEAKLVCLSFLGVGTNPAHIRYLVRRLRRILPQGTAILVCYWSDEGEAPAAKELAKELLEAAGADAYATSLALAVELSMAAAKGELKREEATKGLAQSPIPVRDNKTRRAEKAKTRGEPVH
jgi:predicted PurR-regulated permease PerM